MTTQQLTQLTQRLDHLESKLAFQDDALDALEQLVREQNLELQTIQKHFRLLAEKVMQPNEEETIEAFNPHLERPPHY